MEPILVYGVPEGSSMGLIAAFEWLGQPYRLSRVDMFTEMKNATYAQLNRRLETPVLITDEGQVLTETMAIALWLEHRDQDRRISFRPRSAPAERMHQLMAFINTGFTGAFSPLWSALEMETADAAFKEMLRAYGRENVIERHDRLEEMLGDSAFMLGDRPTLADALLVGVGRWLEFHQVAEISRWPRLAELRQRLDANPAVAFALAIERGEQPQGSGALLGQVALGEVIERFGNAMP